MSTRINLTIQNTRKVPIECVVIGCEPVNGLDVGDRLAPGEVGNYTIDSNNRVFLSWAEVVDDSPLASWDMIHQMAMTCPISSGNNACGLTAFAGCQPYDAGAKAPVSFTFFVGFPNLADWNNPNGLGDPKENPEFHSCSVFGDEYDAAVPGWLAQTGGPDTGEI